MEDWSWPKERPVEELSDSPRPPSKILVGALLLNGRDSCSKSIGRFTRSLKEGGRAFWRTLKAKKE